MLCYSFIVFRYRFSCIVVLFDILDDGFFNYFFLFVQFSIESVRGLYLLPWLRTLVTAPNSNLNSNNVLRSHRHTHNRDNDKRLYPVSRYRESQPRVDGGPELRFVVVYGDLRRRNEKIND